VLLNKEVDSTLSRSIIEIHFSVKLSNCW